MSTDWAVEIRSKPPRPPQTLQIARGDVVVGVAQLALRPGRSFVEHAVAQGLHVFLLSWRNPGPTQAGWDLDGYAGPS